jgi:NADP-dependent 3-hydroxy acid dehydrogenase YdfG
VADHEDCEGLVDFATAEFGRVDVVVNNAGIMPLSPLASLRWMGGIAAIAYAIDQPAKVDVSEIVVRPTASPF